MKALDSDNPGAGCDERSHRAAPSERSGRDGRYELALQEAFEHVTREHQLERLIGLTRQVQQTCADILELRLEARDVLATCSYVLPQAHACAEFLRGKMWVDHFLVRRKS